MEELTLAALLALTGAPDASTSMQVVIGLSGNAQRTVASYECEGVETPVTVEYLNAEPNFLAFLTVGGKKLVFVNVVAASGARYVAAGFEWWTKGADATFTDLQHTGMAPVTCLEINETP